MGRLDLPDPDKDWVAVTVEYLGHLYEEIDYYKSEVERLEYEKCGPTTLAFQAVDAGRRF